MEIQSESIGKFVVMGGQYTAPDWGIETDYQWPDLWVVPEEGVIHEGTPIQIPKYVENVRPGAELTAVIGDPIRQASSKKAWDAIKGFTISNDLTVMGDWPRISDPSFGPTGFGNKLFPTFSPTLSEAVEKRDKQFYKALTIETQIDGDVVAEHSTSQFQFGIAEMISHASQIVPLEENDLVALGDPGRVTGYIDNASLVTCFIEGIGELQNPVDQR